MHSVFKGSILRIFFFCRLESGIWGMCHVFPLREDLMSFMVYLMHRMKAVHLTTVLRKIGFYHGMYGDLLSPFLPPSLPSLPPSLPLYTLSLSQFFISPFLIPCLSFSSSPSLSLSSLPFLSPFPLSLSSLPPFFYYFHTVTVSLSTPQARCPTL